MEALWGKFLNLKSSSCGLSASFSRSVLGSKVVIKKYDLRHLRLPRASAVDLASSNRSLKG